MITLKELCIENTNFWMNYFCVVFPNSYNENTGFSVQDIKKMQPWKEYLLKKRYKVYWRNCFLVEICEKLAQCIIIQLAESTE